MRKQTAVARLLIDTHDVMKPLGARTLLGHALATLAGARDVAKSSLHVDIAQPLVKDLTDPLVASVREEAEKRGFFEPQIRIVELGKVSQSVVWFAGRYPMTQQEPVVCLRPGTPLLSSITIDRCINEVHTEKKHLVTPAASHMCYREGLSNQLQAQQQQVAPGFLVVLSPEAARDAGRVSAYADCSFLSVPYEQLLTVTVPGAMDYFWRVFGDD